MPAAATDRSARPSATRASRTRNADPLPGVDAQAARLAAVAPGLAATDLEPLRAYADTAQPTRPDHLAAVLATTALDLDAAMAAVVAKGKPGRVDMNPLRPHDFAPIDGAEPPGTTYLLLDVDLGARYRGITPEAALQQIRADGRTPLTIEEGVAVLLQVPDALHARTAYSLLASRRADQRVPALWMSYGAPRLGWCWDRNPHSWLGSASAAARVAVRADQDHEYGSERAVELP